MSDIIQVFGPLYQDSYKMACEKMSTLSLSWKIRIPIYLFKMVADDMSGSPLSKKVAQIIKPIPKDEILIL